MNALISSAPAPMKPGSSAHLQIGPTSSRNLLLGDVGPAVAPPPVRSAPPPAAAPETPGSVMSMRAERAFRAMKLTPAQAKEQLERSEYLIHALAPLARRKGEVTARELVAVATDAMAAGHLPPAQVGALIANMPVDKAKLKALLDQHFKGHILAAIHLQSMKDGGAPSSPNMGEGA